MGFPTTAVLESFTRADVNPVGGIFVEDCLATEPKLQVLSNQGAGNSVAAFSGSATATYDPTPGGVTYGPDSEAFFTVSTVDAGNRIEVYARIVDISFADGTDGYCNSVSGSTWSLQRITNNGSAVLGSTFAGPTLTSGDSMGIQIIGSTLGSWHKPAAGSWTQLFTRTDSTYTTAGAIGARMFGNTYRIDGFGGGNVSVPVTVDWSMFPKSILRRS